jgi:tetratricopeptide (TPR) repeat protein
MPLAIELIVPWLNTLTVAEIAAEITQSLDILATDLRDVDARHRSIRAVFDTVWPRLSDLEQAAFMKLTIFRGGFSREAAQAVSDVDLRTLVGLVDKSLVRVDADGRYTLHEMAHQYSSEKLSTCPQTTKNTSNRHCDFYAAYLKKHLEQIAVDDQRKVLREMDNLRAAWHWALDNLRLTALQAMVESLYWLYDVQGWYQEGIEVFTQAENSLAMPEPQGKQGIVYGQILCFQGAFYCRRGDRKTGVALITQSVGLLRQLHAPPDPLASALMLSVYMGAVEDSPTARQYIQEATALAQTQGEQWRVALNNFVSAFHSYYVLGDWETAQHYYETANGLFRQIAGRRGVALTLDGLGSIASHTGDFATARQHIQEALTIQQAITSPPAVADT